MRDGCGIWLSGEGDASLKDFYWGLCRVCLHHAEAHQMPKTCEATRSRESLHDARGPSPSVPSTIDFKDLKGICAYLFLSFLSRLFESNRRLDINASSPLGVRPLLPLLPDPVHVIHSITSARVAFGTSDVRSRFDFLLQFEDRTVWYIWLKLST